MAKVFPLEDILTLTTDILFGKIGGLHDLIAFMLSEEGVDTYRVVEMHKACRESLLRQLPGLANIDTREVNVRNIPSQLRKLVKIYGPRLIVKTIDEELIEFRARTAEAQFIQPLFKP